MTAQSDRSRGEGGLMPSPYNLLIFFFLFVNDVILHETFRRTLLDVPKQFRGAFAVQTASGANGFLRESLEVYNSNNNTRARKQRRLIGYI